MRNKVVTVFLVPPADVCEVTTGGVQVISETMGSLSEPSSTGLYQDPL